MVCAVVWTAPLTMPSAMPRWTIMVPKYETSLTISAARSSVIPLWARSRMYSLAKRSTSSGSFGDRMVTPVMSRPSADALARTTDSSPSTVRSATPNRSRLSAARRIRSSSPSGNTTCLRSARARAERRHVVLPEGDDERILRAADSLLRLGVADLTVLGEESVVRAKASALGLEITGVTILSPKDPELVDLFAKEYIRLRAHKGMTEERAAEIVSDVSYFGTMMVHLGMADGMVSGAVHTTAHTIRPAFEIIK